LTFYGAAVLGSTRDRSGRLGKLLYVPTFLVNAEVASLIGLRRFLTSTQRPGWERVARRAELPTLEE
jgi:hypothetical protein